MKLVTTYILGVNVLVAGISLSLLLKQDVVVAESNSSLEAIERKKFLMREMAKIDPQRTLQAIQVNTTGQAQAELFRRLVGIVAYTDPLQAWEWAESHLSGKQYQMAMIDLAMGFADKGVEEAHHFLSVLPEGPQKEMSIVAALSQSISKPEGLEWALSYRPGDFQNSESVFLLSLAIASVDPETAVDWIDSIEDDLVYNRAIVEIAAVWAADDLDKATEFALSIESDSSFRLQMMRKVCSAISAEDPVEGLLWAANLPVGLRETILVSQFRQIAQTDPNAAVKVWALLEKLNDDDRASLLQEIEHARKHFKTQRR